MAVAIPRDEAQQRLQALYHLAVELSDLRDLQSVLHTALRQCLSLTESQFGFIGLTLPDASALDVVAIQGFRPAPDFYARFHRIPLRPSLFARAVLENRPVRSDDALTDPTRTGQPHGHPRVRAFLGAPLVVHEVPIGMIGVANRPQPYADEHEQLLVTYAAQVAIAIRNAQLYEQAAAAQAELEQKVAARTQELSEAKEALAQKAAQLHRLLTETVGVQERERQRISQDMHDGVSQLLVGALLELRAVSEQVSGGDAARAEASLGRVRDVLHRIEREIRQIIYDLRPPTLDALGLVPSLRRYAARFEQYSGIPCELQAEGEPGRLPPDVEIGMYRILQEALQNVSAHAQAEHASVRIQFTPQAVSLVIADDGCGFDLSSVQAAPAGHYGVIGLYERAESLGGRLTIHTAPGQGSRIEVVVPVASA